jgi:hypothetical protein
MADKGWARKQTLEMVKKAIEREPDITAAQLTLRFGISCWKACEMKRKYKEDQEWERLNNS